MNGPTEQPYTSFPKLSDTPLFGVGANPHTQSCISTRVIHAAIGMAYNKKPENQCIDAFLEELEKHTILGPIIKENIEKWNHIKINSNNRDLLSIYIRDFVLTSPDTSSPCSHEFIMLVSGIMNIAVGRSGIVDSIIAGRKRRDINSEIVLTKPGTTIPELQNYFDKKTIESFPQFCEYLYRCLKVSQNELDQFIDTYVRSLSKIWVYPAVARVYLELIFVLKERRSYSEEKLIEYFRQHPL